MARWKTSLARAHREGFVAIQCGRFERSTARRRQRHPRRVSVARYTSGMPPAPGRAVISCRRPRGPTVRAIQGGTARVDYGTRGACRWRKSDMGSRPQTGESLEETLARWDIAAETVPRDRRVARPRARWPMTTISTRSNARNPAPRRDLSPPVCKLGAGIPIPVNQIQNELVARPDARLACEMRQGL